MHDEPRQKTALGDMPRPAMDAPPKGTSMPTGSMSAGGYQRRERERSSPSAEASQGGDKVRSLYDEMFGVSGLSRASRPSEGMPGAGAGKSMQGGPMQSSGGTGKSMPGSPMQSSSMSGSSMLSAAMGGEQGVAQSTIEISGRWKLTLTPVP